MADIAHACSILALAVCLYAAAAFEISAHRNLPRLRASARNALIAAFLLFSLAMETMVYALLTDDFSIDLVARYSAESLSAPYKIAALYSSKEGSLMTWGWLISLMTVIVLLTPHPPPSRPLGILAAIQAFFLILITIVTNTFETNPAPPSGTGLNPLLQNPGMLLHPPLLFLGFSGLAVVFAFTIGALSNTAPSSEGILRMRRWALFAWCALGMGNIVGAWWAYTELDWGGYWAWDPVENAGLMPWLLSTALLHAIAIERKRGQLSQWRAALGGLTFTAALLSPFITHGGIESPLHGFADSPFPPYFLAAVLITGAATAAVLIHPRDRTNTHAATQFALLSREGAFRITLIGFSILTAIVLIGTIAPGVSDLFGKRAEIERDFFDRAAGPFLLFLVFFMGICPLLGWGRTSRAALRRNLTFPMALTAVAALTLVGIGLGRWYVLTALICGPPVFATLQEWLRGVRARHRLKGEGRLRAFPLLIWSNRPRYGGMIVHLGIVLITIGVIGSSFYDAETTATLEPGESLTFKGYTLTYEGLERRADPDKIITTARVRLAHSGHSLGTLSPQKNFWFSQGAFVGESAIRTRPAEDIFVGLSEYNRETGSATLRVLIHPLILWIWVGGGLVLGGAMIAFWPERKGLRNRAGHAKVRNTCSP